MCVCVLALIVYQRGYLGDGFEMMWVIYSDACVRVRRERNCEWLHARRVAGGSRDRMQAPPLHVL